MSIQAGMISMGINVRWLAVPVDSSACILPRAPAEVPEISNHWKFPRAQVPVIGKNRMNVF